MEPATGLLVSVRSAAEAQAALAGGATLIDVKEPSRGALGRADDSIIAEVLRAVDGRVPVSAALGELRDDEPRPAVAGLSFIKWGLAGHPPGWRARLEREWTTSPPQAVIVAYADWECAQAAPAGLVVDFACRHPGSVLLIDTCCKEASKLSPGRTPHLLDWTSAAWLRDVCERCRAEKVRVALAGSLTAAEIRLLGDVRPNWFAVRGAACDGGRHGEVSSARVAALRHLLV